MQDTVEVIEIWRPVVGYEGIYEVSSFGQIRSLDKSVNCKGGKKVIKLGKILLPKISFGYHRMGLSHSMDVKYFYLHRLIAMAFIPNPHNKPFVNHIDSNRMNNNIDNLEWCTHAENINHAIYVSENKKTKINYEIVLYCLQNFDGSNHIGMAIKFNVRPSLIKRILDGSGYKPWVDRAKREIINNKAVIL